MKLFILLSLFIGLLPHYFFGQEKQTNVKTEITSVTFIDELIIPTNTVANDTKVGGLSGIDYYNNAWYLISDNRNNPRFYVMDIPYTIKGFTDFSITNTVILKEKDGAIFNKGIADPESLRINNNGEVVWTSEGNIKKNINPFIRKSSLDGSYLGDIDVQSKYLVQKNSTQGPRNNGVFEALSLNYNSEGLWVTTELPLLQDGYEPTSTTANATVRIAHIDNTTNTFTKEYAYKLDKVARSGKLEVNGITEILSYGEHTFLVLERSYASGYDDGGNDIKIYKVDTSKATDVSTMDSLLANDFIPAKKTLLLDFNTIRSQVDSGLIDNIEGMTFGPNFKNGHKSLVLVSDNNFNSFGKQITQLLLFHIE